MADVVGYTRQMGVVEDETHRRVSSLLDRTFRVLIERHQGFVIKQTGDGLIASFASTRSAIHCAVKMQRQVRSKPPLSTGDKIAFRIGLHVGDVIIHNNEFYGDCVNIATRIEAMARPGGVCISSAVYEQIKGKVPYVFKSIGIPALKNIASPPELFQLAGIEDEPIVLQENRRSADSSLALRLIKPLRPFVAVLPIEAPIGNPQLCEVGTRLTRELCVTLQEYRWFGVRRLNERLSNAGPQPLILTAAEEPFTAYRVEGHIDLRPDGIRIVVQLLDAVTGVQIWAHVLQLRLGDCAGSLEFIAQQTAAKIEEMVQRNECDRYARLRPADLDLYGFTQQAYSHYYNRTPFENDFALRQFDEILRARPNYAPALAGKAACHFWAGQQLWDGEPVRALGQSYETAKRAVSADPTFSWGQLILAQSELFLGYHDAAIASVRRAIDLSPNTPANLSFLGHALTAAGKFRPAIKMLRAALVLAPNHANRFMWLSNLALAKYHARQPAGALAAATEAVGLKPDHWLARQVQLASLARLKHCLRLEDLDERLNVRDVSQAVVNRLPYKRPSDLEYLTDALAKSVADTR